MKRGTKKIRLVTTGTNYYYIFDLDRDESGKRKRLYAKTEDELKEKIRIAERERSLMLSTKKLQTTKLSECVKFYFKSIVGKVTVSELKRFTVLFENTVYDSAIDKKINDVTIEEIQIFLDKLSDIYHKQSVKEIKNVLEKVFYLYEQDIDFSSIAISDKASRKSCILTPSEYEEIIEYCLLDNCTRFGKNELLFLFCLFTGIMPSKAKKLNKSDFNFKNKTFELENKTYPMNEQTCVWLQEQILLGRFGDTPFFINGNNVVPTLQSVLSTIDSITKKLGLPKGFTGKTLTKSYVIWQLNKGVSAETITEYFGFKNSLKVKEIFDEFEIRTKLFR